MEKEVGDHGKYAQRVCRNTLEYVQGLLRENQRLRRLAAMLENESRSLRHEKLRLEDEIRSLRQEFDRYQEERSQLQRELAKVESANREFAAEFADVERQNNNLTNLYVASYQLHATLDRREVLAGIQEIIINLIGSEQLAVFELDPAAQALALVASFGIDAERYESIPLGTGLIGRCAAEGESFIAGQPSAIGRAADEAELTACIALRLEGRVIGVIAIFALLPQKAGLLADLDHELLDLLATQAATALYSTAIHEKRRTWD